MGCREVCRRADEKREDDKIGTDALSLAQVVAPVVSGDFRGGIFPRFQRVRLLVVYGVQLVGVGAEEIGRA